MTCMQHECNSILGTGIPGSFFRSGQQNYLVQENIVIRVKITVLPLLLQLQTVDLWFHRGHGK